jgi:hypothetical protein
LEKVGQKPSKDFDASLEFMDLLAGILFNVNICVSVLGARPTTSSLKSQAAVD